MTSIPPPSPPDLDAYIETTYAMKPPPIDYGRPPNLKGRLVAAYVLSALLPIAGIGWAAYIHVANTNAPIRRHAVGVLAVAAITFVIYLALIAHSGTTTTTTTYLPNGGFNP
jgi:hypothetical protein